MKISTKGRYALRLMISIAEKGENALTTLREVSRRACCGDIAAPMAGTA